MVPLPFPGLLHHHHVLQVPLPDAAGEPRHPVGVDGYSSSGIGGHPPCAQILFLSALYIGFSRIPLFFPRDRISGILLINHTAAPGERKAVWSSLGRRCPPTCDVGGGGRRENMVGESCGKKIVRGDGGDGGKVGALLENFSIQNDFRMRMDGCGYGVGFSFSREGEELEKVYFALYE